MHASFSNALARALALLFAAAPVAPAIEDKLPPLRLAIVGDSTVASYDKKSPVHGWGEFIQSRVRSRVIVHNAAVSGASTSSFLAEGRWDAVLTGRPSVVLIQFGHNDAIQALSPVQYAANLQRFVTSARAIGAAPILVTPMELRVFRKTGELIPTLQPYADAMRQLAAREHVPLVDLNQLSGQLFSSLGPTRSYQLGSTWTDRKHFNMLGARAMAELVLRELAQMKTPLSREILALPPSMPILAATPIPVKPARPPRRPRTTTN